MLPQGFLSVPLKQLVACVALILVYRIGPVELGVKKNQCKYVDTYTSFYAVCNKDPCL